MPAFKDFFSIGARLAATLLNAWCSLALLYAPNGPNQATMVLAGLCFVVSTALVWNRRGRAQRYARPALLGIWTSVITWFLWLPAPKESDWLPECQVAPTVEIQGDQVSVHGVRDFLWTSSQHSQHRWLDQQVNLSQLRRADIFLSFWGPQRICHTFVSFGFERPNQPMDYLAVSIEVRKHQGQSYSPLGSLFRQFPLIYIWARETDVVGVRTNFRDEQVYRYRLQVPQAWLRQVFLRYAEETNRLAAHPRWYNAITSNCGIDILRTVWGDRIRLIPSLDQLSNGMWEAQAYSQGRLEPRLPFEELRGLANISRLAQQASPQDFSQKIRRQDVWLKPRQP